MKGKGLLQEKFQVTAPKNQPDNETQWASFEANRHVVELKERTYTSNKGADLTEKITNMMPPGMFIDNQSPNFGKPFASQFSESPHVPHQGVQGIEKDVLRKGFANEVMSPIDDMFTNEHVEEFYGEATVDGETGFVERNNYLDRT